jgi:5'-nucleotidase (lipoprotein e(P4) family)
MMSSRLTLLRICLLRRAMPVLMVASLVGCQGVPQTPKTGVDATLPVYWVQNAAEYQALCYQAYRWARERFDAAPANAPRVVVMDLDETVLDNSAYAAWNARRHAGYSDETWNQWVADAVAAAVPGAPAFIAHVRQNGGVVIFISNRASGTEDATIRNLEHIGIPGVQRAHLLLRTAESSKAARFNEVVRSAGNPIMYIGDNLTDFGPQAAPLTKDADLQAFAHSQRDAFGTSFIVLPNPVYGSWLPRSGEEVERGIKPWK